MQLRKFNEKAELYWEFKNRSDIELTNLQRLSIIRPNFAQKTGKKCRFITQTYTNMKVCRNDKKSLKSATCQLLDMTC